MRSRLLIAALVVVALVACANAQSSKSLGDWTLKSGADLSIASAYVPVRFSLLSQTRFASRVFPPSTMLFSLDSAFIMLLTASSTVLTPAS